MHVTEHTLNGERTMTPFVQKLVNELGECCREYRLTEEDDKVTFVFPYMKRQGVIMYDGELMLLAGAYIISSDDDTEHYFILVAGTMDGDSFLFTPVDEVQEVVGMDLGNLPVLYIQQHDIGFVDMLAPLVN
jgi:hypothetical protein